MRNFTIQIFENFQKFQFQNFSQNFEFIFRVPNFENPNQFSLTPQKIIMDNSRWVKTADLADPIPREIGRDRNAMARSTSYSRTCR